MLSSGFRNHNRSSALFAFLVALFLVAASAFALWPGYVSTRAEEAEEGTITSLDPYLQITPEQAHMRLMEKDVGWPEGMLRGGAREADAVLSGVRVSIPYDTVTGETNHPSSAVRVELIRGASAIQTVDTTTNPDGLFTADLSTGNISSGDTVRVTDMVSGSPVNVNCTLTGSIDTGTDEVKGTSASNTFIDVYISTPSTYYGDILPGVAHKTVLGGNWATDFSGTFNLWRGDVAFIYSTDANDNIVMDVARTGGSLVVYPQYDDVMGYYSPDTLLQVKAGIMTETTGTAKDGFFEAWFAGHDIAPGEMVTCQMGTSSRGITVSNITAGQVSGTLNIAGNCPANKNIRLTMNPYIKPVVFEDFTDAQGNFDINLGTYDPTGTEIYNVAWYDADGDCCIYEFQTAFGGVSTTWYLAEGYTGTTPNGGSFDTYILLQNSTTEDAQTTLTFQVQDGEAQPLGVKVDAGSRVTVHLDELPGLDNDSVSTKVVSNNRVSINAERAMYFNYEGKQGGHDSIGVNTTNKTWYFAEGYTGEEFDTWILVQNPGSETATVKFDYHLQDGTAPDTVFTVPAGTRQSIKLDDQPGLASASVATLVTSDKPIVAERAMYFNYYGKIGGSDSLGINAPARDWYMAEGYTGYTPDGGNFDTWVLVQNPSDTNCTVTMKFQLMEGIAPDLEFYLAAGTRQSIKLDDLPGLADASVSTHVSSDVPIVAERAEYFNYYGKLGGHTSNAATSAARKWFLPEGYTGGTVGGGSFDTWVLVQNPSDTTDAIVTLSFQLPYGAVVDDQVYAVEKNKRLTVHLNELPGLSNTDVSTTVSSNEPVIVERAMYFNYYGIEGGHDSIGIPIQ